MMVAFIRGSVAVAISLSSTRARASASGEGLRRRADRRGVRSTGIPLPRRRGIEQLSEIHLSTYDYTPIFIFHDLILPKLINSPTSVIASVGVSFEHSPGVVSRQGTVARGCDSDSVIAADSGCNLASKVL